MSGRGVQQLLPLFLISIVLHVAVLLWLVPKFLQPTFSQSVTEVEIVDLVAPKPSSSPPVRSQPSAKPAPTKSAIDNTTQSQPAAQASPTLIPTPIPIPTPTPKSTPTPTPTPKATSQPTPTPTPPAMPIPTPPSSTHAILDLFTQLAAGSRLEQNSTPPDPKLFDDPSLFFDAVTPAAQARLKSDIVRAIAINRKTPVQVYVEILVTQAQQSDFQVSERGSYGNGIVYEVRQGTNVWYINLVPTKDQTGTLIIVWQRDPSIPIQ